MVRALPADRSTVEVTGSRPSSSRTGAMIGAVEVRRRTSASLTPRSFDECPRRRCRRRRRAPDDVVAVAARAPDDVVASPRRAPHDVVAVASACPRRCCRSRRRRTPCPTRCCRRRRSVPQTMLSPSLSVPQTMLSPSLDGAPHDVVAVERTCPRRCCRRRGRRAPHDVVAGRHRASRAPDDAVLPRRWRAGSHDAAASDLWLPQMMCWLHVALRSGRPARRCAVA